MSEIIKYELEGTSEILDALDALNYKELIRVIRNVERKALSKNIVVPLRSVVNSYHPNVNPRVGIEFAGGKCLKQV